TTRSSAPAKNCSSSPGPARTTSTGIRDARWTKGSTRVASTNPPMSATRSSKSASARALISSGLDRPPRSTVTSMSALRRATPWRIAAWAPKRNQRTPSRAKARWSRASSSAMGGGAEGTRGAVDRALQRDVVGEILAALLRRRPVGPETAHVLPERLGRLEGRQAPALGDLARPVLLLEGLGRVPGPPRISPQVLRVHVAQYIVARATAHACGDDRGGSQTGSASRGVASTLARTPPPIREIGARRQPSAAYRRAGRTARAAHIIAGSFGSAGRVPAIGPSPGQRNFSARNPGHRR